jgi:hypothetical protein
MGLDMYAKTIKASLVGEQQIEVDLYKALGVTGHNENASEEENEAITSTNKSLIAIAKAKGDFNDDFAYWRKFHQLHGWMESLYNRKGGTHEFNCVNVRLMPEDLDLLEQDASTLKDTAGFFFGNLKLSDEAIQDVHDFIGKAREAIEQSNAVFYDSWW